MKNKEFTPKQQENKKEDRKALKGFWLLMLGGFLVGILVGFLSVFLKDVWSAELLNGLTKVGSIVGIYGGYVVVTVLLVISIIMYKKSRREFADWDGEDEEVYNRMDTRVSYVSWFSQLMMIASYLFLATGAYVNLGDKERTKALLDASFSGWVVSIILVLGSMIYGLVASVIMQQKMVNFAKEMNPEKHGSVYDMKFNKKWLESCDEAEKFITYKSSYMAMQAGSYTCMILWMVCLVGMLIFEIGILPLCMVLIVWLVQTSTYALRVIYFAKHPSEVMK